MVLTMQQSRLIKMQLASGDSLRTDPEAQWEQKGYKRNELFSSNLFRIYESPNLDMFGGIFTKYILSCTIGKMRRSGRREKQMD